MGCGVWAGFGLAEDTDRWRAIVNAVMNYFISWTVHFQAMRKKLTNKMHQINQRINCAFCWLISSAAVMNLRVQ
jgi:hypothetical protein